MPSTFEIAGRRVGGNGTFDFVGSGTNIKLFDFMAAGRPIVFACDSSNNPVADAGAGITVRPGNPGELAGAMRRLASLPENERNAMGLAGRRYVEDNHGFRQLAARLAACLNLG